MKKSKKTILPPEDEIKIVFKQTEYSQDKEIENENLKKIVEDFKDNESFEEVSFRKNTENPSVKSDLNSQMSAKPKGNKSSFIITTKEKNIDNDKVKHSLKAESIGDSKTRHNYDNIYNDNLNYSIPNNIESNNYQNKYYVSDVSQSRNKTNANIRQDASNQNQHAAEEPVSYLNQWYSKN